MVSKICANCKFFFMGDRCCHRHSPSPLFTVIPDRAETEVVDGFNITQRTRLVLVSEKYIRQWPPVAVDDFCGEFESE
jgi:hypothetical protein